MDKECLEAQNSGDLNRLYLAIYKLIFKLLRKEMASKGLSFSFDRMKEITHDATTLFMEYYFIRNNKIIIRFIPMAQRFMKMALYGAKYSSQRRWDKIIQLSPDIPIEQPPKAEKEEYKDYFLDIYTEHPRSKWIIYYLWSNKYYAQAIKKIAKITGKKWIYERAVKLHHLWEVLHWKKYY